MASAATRRESDDPGTGEDQGRGPVAEAHPALNSAAARGVVPGEVQGCYPRFPMKSEIWNTLSLVVLVIVLAVFGPWLWREVRDLPGRRALAARANERIVTLDVG